MLPRLYDVFVDNRTVVVNENDTKAFRPLAAAEAFDDDENDDMFPLMNATLFGPNYNRRRRHRAFGARRGSVTAPKRVAVDSSALAVTEGDKLRWRALRRIIQTQGFTAGADGDAATLDALVAATFAKANDAILSGLLRAARTGVDVTQLSSIDHFGLHRSDATFLRALADEIQVDHPGFKESNAWNADTRRTPAKAPCAPRDSFSSTRREDPPSP